MELLASGNLIRCLGAQVEGAVVYAVVRDDNAWLTNRHPSLDGVFTYREKPEELLDTLRDFLPDYVIDLDGTRKMRRLKSRLKVLDFTIRRKRSGNDFPVDSFETCRLFDVEDDGEEYRFVPEPPDMGLLPSDFLQGFLVLALDNGSRPRPLGDDLLIELAVMTERPMVVTGNASDRALANRISQASGCAVFPACGDFTRSQTAALISLSKGVIAFDPLWTLVAGSLGIPVMYPGSGNPENIALWARSLFASPRGRSTR